MAGLISMGQTAKNAARAFSRVITGEPLFAATLILTAAVSLYSRPHLAAIHWNVIATLFSLMLLCHAFDRCQLFSSAASLALGTFKTPRKLGLAMVLATGIFAMLVTNDVALLAVVPLTMKMAKVSGKDPLILVVLETVSANIFSTLTPFGNPQNLYLYAYFRIPPVEFLRMMFPFCLTGIALLILLDLVFSTGGEYRIRPRKFEIYDGRLLAGSSAAFALNILSVFRLIDYRIALGVTLLTVLILSPRLIAKVDYFLLLTFVLFFLFTDSVTGMPLIHAFFARVLHSRLSVLLASAGLSQVISNVPAAVLLSGFTRRYRELLYGVSAGGLGTLVASLASLISYRFYIREYRSGRYVLVFSLVNFFVLAVMIAAAVVGEKLI